MLKPYVCKFKGYWPVPATAVIIAEGVSHAKELLERELKVRGLEQDIPLTEFTELDNNVADAHILSDGDY